ncbi:AhpA/YtjB family protein [Marinomonas spartinae]|uniref:AhpA/YtjB family protein n=1 Tax=Marinomonas spartinae TaxID=1792290 RepID=UPI0018F271AC|nr:AhpA/YtjB family protein [Marinomonas spartinae]MBJ7555689.1 hypothetical protein [Marinomonas spartinae]
MQTQMKSNKAIAFLHKKLSASAITITTFMSLMIITVGLFWFTITQALENYLDQQIDVLGNSLATQAAFNATQSILTNDLLSLNVLLNRLVLDDNILSARVYNKKDELLAEASSGNAKQPTNADFRPSKTHRVYTSSIRFQDDVVGHVLITLDKTPAQETLKHLTNLLIGVSIFICAIALLLVVLVTRWLFSPINDATDALYALAKGHHDAKLPNAAFKEARALCHAIHEAQNLEWPKPEPIDEPISDDITGIPAKTQLEIDFETILAESKRRSCMLFIDILNINEWHENMTPLQVANLLTPIYRAIFQTTERFHGQVHQYQDDSVLILFNAEDTGDHLYMEAISAAHVIIGLTEALLENELYHDAPALNLHLGLHKGTPHITEMMKNDTFDADEIGELMDDITKLTQSTSINKLVISEQVFTMNDIQNRVFTSLPEIIDIDENEILIYEVKGLAEKYQKRVYQYIKEINRADENLALDANN